MACCAAKLRELLCHPSSGIARLRQQVDDAESLRIELLPGS